ncbi:DNA cytosine methyltransferase [Halomonas llamarensis]|uniref:DNA (cytosine-5-)-methyltransferase n=1 Tax=Halomonas llamarensis TaxID=2945104 RepID=A0ABT0ST25_9GAMM|nr:DNA cytosine methyltransferase [Halomonas llamarensis]MCL7930975.1 DNA cytosine methyltransferase [Halomonas llamarensis]
MIEAVDLFCGAGGLTAGLRQANVTVRAGYDIEESCRFAYEHNNQAQFITQDVGELTGDDINGWYQDPDAIRLLAGCAPCQPFSTYNQGKDTTKDKKWPLLGAFARLIQEAQPELVTMENVPSVTKHEIYHDFVESLKQEGYHVWADTVACVKYGLPQSRRRHVLLASKLGPIELIDTTHQTPVTVKEVIEELEPVTAGAANPNDPLHIAASLSELNMKRIRHSVPGGSWKDWPKELVAGCHAKKSGKTYPSVYGRMEWEKPSPTMTTLCYGFGNGRFGHPEQHRAITLREAAMLQSFPAEYQFIAPGQPFHFRTIGRMIGNAVPVKLGEVIGESFTRHIRKALQVV